MSREKHGLPLVRTRTETGEERLEIFHEVTFILRIVLEHAVDDAKRAFPLTRKKRTRGLYSANRLRARVTQPPREKSVA